MTAAAVASRSAREPDLVSVIIPCYQQGRFLTACVESLRAQSYPRWEEIVVDDGSTDDTAAVAEALARRDSRVLPISQSNAGLAAARNRGLGAARGAYLAFLDADDLFEPRKLECQVAHLTRHPDMAAVCGNVRYFDTDTPAVFRPRLTPGDDPDWIKRAVGSPPLPLTAWIWHNRIPVCSPVIRRVLVDAIGPFDTTLAAYEDWEFWLRAVLAGHRFGLVAAAETDCLIRVHGSSLSAQPGVADDRLFRVRALFHRHLGQRHPRERRLNLALMLLSGMAAGASGRSERHALLRGLPLGWGERLMATTAMAIESTGLPLGRLKAAVQGWREGGPRGRRAACFRRDP
jgi:glycosyltransferase involved in cell wall biosynthesis